MTDSITDVLKKLPPPERRILQVLREAAQPAALSVVAAKAGFRSEDEAYSAASWLQKKSLVDIQETGERHIRRGPEGLQFSGQGFPERRIHQHVARHRDGTTLQELRTSFSEHELNVALAWWKRKSLGRIEKRGSDTVLVANAQVGPTEDETALAALAGSKGASLGEEEFRRRFPKGFQDLLGRPNVLEVREARARILRLTSRGREVAAGPVDLKEGIAELTPELLRTGAWKTQELRAYDLTTPVPRTFAGKPHPLMQIIEEVRSIFVELGFQEIEEEFVQSAFWNLDALFIPQDHPAREMQDTFYLRTPPTVPVGDDLIQRISKVHESGGGTGSRGWGAPLDPAESRRALLRTHTTVGTIKHLAKNPEGPMRVFSIGRVFRKETMDATHLPEFHQIEGIATEKGADFRMLLGILQEFYRRLGFEKLRWRPGYFPYTEPSMEVEVWTGKKWMELGGCGIFRPEVTEPFGVKTPVLAWGLGLERLAMLRLGLTDIRNLYVSDLEWLRNQPLL